MNWKQVQESRVGEGEESRFERLGTLPKLRTTVIGLQASPWMLKERSRDRVN